MPSEWPDPTQPWAWPETTDMAAGQAYFRCSKCQTVVELGGDFADVVRCPNEAAHGVSVN